MCEWVEVFEIEVSFGLYLLIGVFYGVRVDGFQCALNIA